MNIPVSAIHDPNAPFNQVDYDVCINCEEDEVESGCFCSSKCEEDFKEECLAHLDIYGMDHDSTKYNKTNYMDAFNVSENEIINQIIELQ